LKRFQTELIKLTVAVTSSFGKTDLVDLIGNVLDDLTTCAEFIKGNLMEIDDLTLRKNIGETYQQLIPIIPQVVEIAVHIYVNSPEKKRYEEKLVEVLNSVKLIIMTAENLIKNFSAPAPPPPDLEELSGVDLNGDPYSIVNGLVEFVNSENAKSIPISQIATEVGIPTTAKDATTAFATLVKSYLALVRAPNLEKRKTVSSGIRSVLYLRRIVLEKFISEKQWNSFISIVNKFCKTVVNVLLAKLLGKLTTKQVDELVPVIQQIVECIGK